MSFEGRMGTMHVKVIGTTTPTDDENLDEIKNICFRRRLDPFYES